jgi:uncharacterized membrane protein YoaK (UPF0700 family)
MGPFALAVILMGVAGFIDAFGFLRLGHLFVSFMSGDTTQFSVAAEQARRGEALLTLAIIGLYVGGVMVGQLLEIGARRWRRPVVLSVEATLIVVAAFTRTAPGALPVALIVAMGVQNSAVHKAGETKLSVTYVTGTLVSFGQKLVLACFDRQARWGWAPYLSLWLGLVIGAALGAMAFAGFGFGALIIPAVLLFVLAIVTAVPQPVMSDGDVR